MCASPSDSALNLHQYLWFKGSADRIDRRSRISVSNLNARRFAPADSVMPFAIYHSAYYRAARRYCVFCRTASKSFCLVICKNFGHKIVPSLSDPNFRTFCPLLYFFQVQRIYTNFPKAGFALCRFSL